MKIEWTKTALGRRGFLKGATALGAAAALPMGLGGRAMAAEDGTLRVRSYGDMQSIDPAFSKGVIDEEIHASIYNKLIQYKPGREWDWQMDAAAMIEQGDETHIKFALRDDIGFTNGFGAMTAEDVKFSFERIVDEATDSPNKPDMGPLSHVEVTGEREGTIVLKEPFAPLWSIALPYITGNIVSKKAWEAAGGKATTDPLAESGPYLRDSWSPKEKTVLKRNPNWKGEAPAWDTIEILPIDDENTAEIAFEAGELDFTRVSLGSVERYRAGVPNGGTLLEYPSLYYAWLGMNLDHPKLQNKKLRQAIQHAIDVPSVLEAAYFGAVEPSTGIIAPGLAGHRPQSLVPPQADFAKAAELLAESGETNVTLKLDTLNKTTFTTAAQVIQATLAQIGITVEVNVLESGAFWASADNEDLQLVLNRYSMTPDPYYATSWFTTEQVGHWNWEQFSNDEFDKIHAEASQLTDQAKRDEMYRRAQDLMEESGAYRFLTHEATPVIHSAGVVPALRPDGLALLRYFGKA
ncbi:MULTISPECIES: ABC transporter substrate-binding protein [unclassified Leisingera]|uniref:ABC transporter substrate-binding protein n=1 Tax=unclassified Leisingera TaxID=2614906 RepID=UPI0002F8E1EA|nr:MULTISPECIES: ABC transporter substrate-binding protein [unclassified Leisingera]KIC25008.1 peptide ABC transporter substrate-binding protein [Leisingera sp. ANG-M6]KIC26807.1 peptide ABC transporter substrate-binding protein [Leisingera sp. ANG-S3]KIC31352.1 peptide ABC transporter substrate-binding protein [Leisingera sp. ANG-S5]KIC49510.1 peptide ABC transporter substrate-binding protein [Leisingera sp. ANG-S]KID07126.1 peptide ABC transporter substrate-binding protein [Leisingera sp. AN